MRLTLTKLSTALLVFAASTNVALATHHNFKGEFKGEPPCPPPCMLKDGFYVGAQVGYDSYRVRHSFDVASTAEQGGTFSGTSRESATGWVGGLMAGYGTYLTDMFYLGAEVMGNYSNAQGSNAFSLSFGTSPFLSGSSNTRVHGSWGLAVLPGLRLNNTSLGYVRLGYNWADFKSNASVTSSGSTASTSKSETVHGFNYGVGIETLLYENWSVRTEFTHTNYSSYHVEQLKVEPSDNQFMLGLIYHFSC